MEKIIENSLKEKVKTSVDLDSEVLETIELLAKLTNASRGTIIEALGFHGFTPLLESIRMNWQGLLSNEDINENKKKKIKNLLQDLSKIQKYWNNQIKDN